ncbi:MAG: transcription elongation factor GreA [Chlorobiota bacterium]
MSDVIYLSRQRFEELQAELRQLRSQGRKEIAQKIADARSHGDLSENADYDAALQAQQMLEMRIARLERILARARVIDPKELPNDGKVYIFSTVRLRNCKTGSVVTYTLVGDEEADFTNNKLSVSSPLGKALLGKQSGERIRIRVPAGEMEYEIVEVLR